MSTKEIETQIVAGSPMTERECYMWLVNNLGEARDAARGLAHLRKDMRWLAVSGIFDEVKAKATMLMNKPQGLVIPGATFR